MMMMMISLMMISMMTVMKVMMMMILITMTKRDAKELMKQEKRHFCVTNLFSHPHVPHN